MLYPELFKQLEAVRWDMDKDIPWDSFDPTQLTDEQATTIKMNAITEWSALPATEMFLRDNRDDSDFCAFMSVWFFEEQKHSLVLMEYLRRFRPELVPTEEELHAVRFEFDPAPALSSPQIVTLPASSRLPKNFQPVGVSYSATPSFSATLSAARLVGIERATPAMPPA